MPTKSIAIIDHVGCKAGMDSYSGSLAQGFIDIGVECFLFSNFEIAGAKNYSLFRKQKGSKISSVLNQIVPFWKAGKICKKNNMEECMVHFFSFEIKDLIALRILRFFGLKILGIVHDVEHLAGKGDVYREKILNEFCDKIMVHNTFSKDALLKLYPSLESKTKVIPHMNFHNLPSGKDERELRAKWKMQEGKKYLLFFGQIKDAKGLDILLGAMSKTDSSIHLIIAGRVWQTSFDKYEQAIAHYGLKDRVQAHIRFITDDERDELFTACDAIILPYKIIYQSGVMQVAMSYRIPIVSSDIPPFREMMGNDVYGTLFESENANDLAEKINLTLVNSKEMKEKSVRAHEMAREKFSNKQIAKDIINW